MEFMVPFLLVNATDGKRMPNIIFNEQNTYKNKCFT